jgi:3-methyladenine DNA glycosylase AlkD
MASLEEALRKLKAKARPGQLEGMARYGMATQQRLGVSIPDLRNLAKELRKDHKLAVELWKTGISEARILAAMVDEPEKLTEAQMEDWVKEINSWDICDQVCMNLFEKTPLAWKKILDWSKRDEEFIKRTAFALIACLAWHDKGAEDGRFV